jgi:hydroxymethylbilane synthase
MKIRIGTRGSALALVQTRSVADLLRRARPELRCEIVEITTHGDLDADRPLPEIGGEGLFTARIEQALNDGAIDAAVHSLKDLPVEDPAGLAVGAVIGREEAREVLVARDGLTLATLPAGAVVGSSSTRRQAQLLLRRGDIVVKPIRGNVETRIAKVTRGEFDATVLAGAGVVRLGLNERITEWIELSDFLPAPGQGAIAVQCRSGDARTVELLACIDEPLLRAETDAERWFLRVLGAGCSAPVAAFARARRDTESRTPDAGTGSLRIWMKGRVSAPDGSKTIAVEGGGSDPRMLAESLAREALRAGAVEILAAAGKNNRLGGPGSAVRPAVAVPDAVRPDSHQGSPSALEGKRVLVTRAREQAAGLCAELAARGAVPVLLPMISIEPAGDAVLLDDALRDLARFRWVLFTSANGVEAFVRRANELRIAPRGPKIAAVGSATAEALSRLGLSADFTPAEHTAAALADGLCRFDPDGVSGARILVPRAEEGREEAVALLQERGASVREIVVYRTVPAALTEADVARLPPGIDAVLFTSGSTVRAYCAHARRHAVLAGVVATAVIACIGPSTRETAEENGLAVAVTPAEHTGRALVAALERHFAGRGGGKG